MKVVRWFLDKSSLFKLAIIIVAVLVGGQIYRRVIKKQNSQPQYQTAIVTKGTLIVSVSASGAVSTSNSSSVTTSASGIIDKVYVHNGDFVRAGSAIAKIDLDQTSKQKYVAALSSYQGSKNSLDSTNINYYSLQSKLFAANQKFINDAVARDLSADDPTYIQENDDWLAAEAEFNNQKNSVSQAQNSLNSSALLLQQSSPTIYAPISGTVSGLSLQEGQVIGSSVKVANVETKTASTITVNMTEIDISKIKVDDKATITLDAYGDKTYTGKVISVDTFGSVSSGVTSYPVVIKLDTDAQGVLSNMKASANIITNTKDNVLLIPTSALQTTNGQVSVRVMKNGQVSNVIIETGLSSDSEVEITSGLSEGDEVVTSVISTANSTQTQSGQSNSVFSSFGGERNTGGGFVVRRQND